VPAPAQPPQALDREDPGIPPPKRVRRGPSPWLGGGVLGALIQEGIAKNAEQRDRMRDVPPRRAPGPKRKRVLMIVGLAVFGVGYVGSVVSMILSPKVFDEKLMIPLAGPWMSLGDVDGAPISSTEKGLD